ncbi:ATP-binding protein [Tunicatimonas pelagia]|uniref:ATP-binding protein n=1 Tax=Tunicatimonas pelagia TaxID=931531 RepID=UPI002666AE0A|nr:ATP-binding protein [Tunicatimonas pelagia]WKN42676.1 ATP-binding protein [Tunicatimonas pelagia]
MVSKRSSALRSKVVIGFILVFSALLIAAYISYESFSELQQASQTISQPDLKIKRIDSILMAVTTTENTLQEYSVLRSSNKQKEASDKLEVYYDQVKEVERIIGSLESETEKEEYTLDSVVNLILDKLVSLDAFREIEEQRGDFDFYNQALSELESEVSTIASQRNAPHFLEDTARQNIDIRIDKKTILGRLFSRDKEEQPFATAEQEDEPITLAPDSVRQLLRQVRNDQAQRQQRIDQQELTYLQNNAQVMGSIYQLVGQLKEQEQARSQERVVEARAAMDEAIIRIAIILIVAFLSTILIVYFILADITRSEFYRNRLLVAKSGAERLARVKEDFLANMSHEIRTPLTAILGFTEQLKFSQLDAEQQKYVGALDSSSRHLMSLVNDILDFSKIEAGKINYEHEPFDVVRLISEVKHDLQLMAQEKQLDLRYSIKGDEHKYVAGDAFRLKQVLYNLVSNALKFTHEGEVLIMAKLKPVSAQTTQLILEVIDTGIGIPEEKQASIFDAFHQSDLSTTRKYGGTGLGLAICKKIIEGQGGSLSVASNEGAGSIFRVTIQYRSESAILVEENLEEADAPDVMYSGGEALIIDDHPLNVTLLELALSARGIQSVGCYSGKEAVLAAEEKVFDIIFCDLHMPEMDGAQVIQALKENALVEAYDTPIVAFTANIQAEEKLKYEQIGVQDFLLKPFSQRQLDQLLKKYLVELDTELVMESQAEQLAPKQRVAIVSLENVRQFTGDDNEALVSYLKTFMDTAQEAGQQLQVALKEKSAEQVSFYAHKLVSQVELLQVADLTKQLKYLESTASSGLWSDPLAEGVEKAIVMNDALIGSVQNEVALLESSAVDANSEGSYSKL